MVRGALLSGMQRVICHGSPGGDAGLRMTVSRVGGSEAGVLTSIALYRRAERGERQLCCIQPSTWRLVERLGICG